MFMVCITGTFDRSFGDYSTVESGGITQLTSDEVYQLFGSNKYSGVVMDINKKIWVSSAVFIKIIKKHST